MMATRIYLGNIPFSVTEQQILELLAPYHPSDVRIATHRDTGQPRGFAHVTVASQDDLLRAVEALDGTHFNGRRIVCAPANERERGPDYAKRAKPDHWDGP